VDLPVDMKHPYQGGWIDTSCLPWMVASTVVASTQSTALRS